MPPTSVPPPVRMIAALLTSTVPTMTVPAIGVKSTAALPFPRWQQLCATHHRCNDWSCVVIPSVGNSCATHHRCNDCVTIENSGSCFDRRRPKRKYTTWWRVERSKDTIQSGKNTVFLSDPLRPAFTVSPLMTAFTKPATPKHATIILTGVERVMLVVDPTRLKDTKERL